MPQLQKDVSLTTEQNVFNCFNQGILKGESITVPLASCLTGLEKSVLQIKIKIVSCDTADYKLVKQEVNGTVILPPLVFPASTHKLYGAKTRVTEI